MSKRIDCARQIETNGGNIVKSNYERTVADFLYRHQIDYVYEFPVRLANGTALKPDFYLPAYDAYIEIWGMKGDGRYNYIRHLKREAYKKSGIKLIELWPNERNNYQWWLKVKFQDLLGVPFPQKAPIPYYRN